MFDNIFGNIVVVTLLVSGLAYAIKWYRDNRAAKTETKIDDFAVDGLILLLKLADKYFDGPYFDSLFAKALEILEEEPETSEVKALKTKLEPIVKK